MATAATGALVPSAATADGKPASGWGAAVMPQPFEKGAFRAVEPPAWVRDTVGVGYTLSVMSPAQRKEAAGWGVTLSEVGFVDPLYAYYDSKLLKRRSPHVPLDRVKKDIEEYQKLGVRILGVYPPTLQGEVWELHPDWRRIATDTDQVPEVDLKKFAHGGMLCPLGPYGDFFIDVLCEIATQFPAVSAFSFDGLHHAGGCYCKHCRANYTSDTGGPIPKRDMQSDAFRKYLHWADRRLEALVQRMQQRLKALNPDIALVTWTTNAGRFGHLLDIPRNMPARLNLLFDAPDQEFWMDETNRGASVVPAFGAAYVWAVTNHRTAFAEPYLMSRGNPYGKDSFPAHEVERRVLLVLTHGAGPSLAVLQPERLKPAVKNSLAAVTERKPWLTHKRPEPWAALLVSDNTRVFYGRSSGQVEERYLANVFGFFRAALEEHLPVNLINDWNLTPDDLAPYKVLVLPNAACMSDEQCAAVAQFVERGGGVVASLDTGLCDEFGTPRKTPALANVLGVTHQGIAVAGKGDDRLDENFARTLPPEYWAKRKGVWDFKRGAGSPLLATERLDALIGSEFVTFKGPVVRTEPLPGSTVHATVRPKDSSKGEPLPAIVSRTAATGKAVYFAAGIDAAHYLSSYPYYRATLARALRWAAAAAPPVEVKAPMCVHATTVRQNRNGERLVVHLFNDVSTTTGHGHPAEEVPLREETIPIHNIEVALRGYRVKEVRQEPGARVLPFKQRGEETTFTVPKLEIHTMAVVELG
ncbi:beta-galactosidase trimerization domain-containing protein [Gemmata sp. JC673]|uniref:Beta-galactosidase trimerization domain-containing protein n=1 Tax=Gemmata algarum TaxID=2975278 RepID=A0ABU5ETL5_9BACT|nr:beta-galactosidase trimerization domain-containing protein [Gemmata algarum]MDY3557967.1 beta-galactosidase trimerization domain-containing protein [Gemmata algarum]